MYTNAKIRDAYVPIYIPPHRPVTGACHRVIRQLGSRRSICTHMCAMVYYSDAILPYVIHHLLLIQLAMRRSCAQAPAPIHHFIVKEQS